MAMAATPARVAASSAAAAATDSDATSPSSAARSEQLRRAKATAEAARERVEACRAEARAALEDDLDDGNIGPEGMRRYARCLAELEGEKALLPCRERLREVPYAVDRVCSDRGFAVLVGRDGTPTAGDVRRVGLGALMRGVERAYWRSWNPGRGDGKFCPAPFRRLAAAMMRAEADEDDGGKPRATQTPLRARRSTSMTGVGGNEGALKGILVKRSLSELGNARRKSNPPQHRRSSSCCKRNMLQNLDRRPACADNDDVDGAADEEDEMAHSPHKKRRTRHVEDVTVALGGSQETAESHGEGWTTQAVKTSVCALFWTDFCMDLADLDLANSEEMAPSESATRALDAISAFGDDSHQTSAEGLAAGTAVDHAENDGADEADALSVLSSISREVDLVRRTRCLQNEVLVQSSQKLSVELANLQVVEDVDVGAQWDSCESDVFDIYLADESDSQKLARYVQCGGRCAEANDYIASRAEDIREHLRLRKTVKMHCIESASAAREAVREVEAFGRWLGMDGTLGICIEKEKDSDRIAFRERCVHLSYKLRHNAAVDEMRGRAKISPNKDKSKSKSTIPHKHRITSRELRLWLQMLCCVSPHTSERVREALELLHRPDGGTFRMLAASFAQDILSDY